MIRILTSFLTIALYASIGTLAVSAQEMPYPPGALPPSSAANATAQPDPAMIARAKSWFTQIQSGKVDRSQLETGANGNLTDATLSNAKTVVGALGPPVSFVQQQTGSQGGISYGIYLLTFKNGQKLDFLFAVDRDGKIASLGLGSPH
jgi:hypothetical protein